MISLVILVSLQFVRIVPSPVYPTSLSPCYSLDPALPKPIPILPPIQFRSFIFIINDYKCIEFVYPSCCLSVTCKDDLRTYLLNVTLEYVIHLLELFITCLFEERLVIIGGLSGNFAINHT